MKDFARFRVADQRSGGDHDYKVLRRGAVELGALAVSAVLGDELVLVTKGKKGVTAGVHAKDDASAPSSVTAVGSAVGDVFFPTEGNGAVSAVSCLYVNSNVIYKHNYLLSLGKIVDRDEAPIGPYGLLSPLARMIRRMGVPRKPKVWRRQFSMYR